MGSLSGKVAIVTGASRGIGQAIALRLALNGAFVIVSARDQTRLDAVVEEIQAMGQDAARFAADLREATAASALTTFALEHYGAIDIVVNNAGATKRGAFLDLSDADFEDGFALKYYGTVRLCRAAWRSLQASQGSILNIIGVGGRTPGLEFAIGGSVNAALLSLTKVLADLGIHDGVQVNAINPGAVRTDRLAQRLANGGSNAAEHFVQAAKITRLGEPEDIANLVAFVVGPEGRFLQGALIDMDGGQTKTI